MNNPHLPETSSRPYFLNIFDILPRCSSTINRSPRLLWMHPHYEKGLVWDASRIELLWDSILHGLPIGSFTTCGGSEPSSHWRPYDDLLLDGEQRCLAIALGMHGPELENPAHDPDLILWIDLHPRIPPHSEREFLLRLTTADHPWGYGKSDDSPPLDPSCLASLREFIGGNPDPLPELESFVTNELENRFETMERLLLYDPLTSPQGIVPAHLALIARDKPEIHAFLLATDWPPEDLADMLVPANPERDELIKAVTMIACFAHDVTAAVHVCRDFAEKSKLWLILGECTEQGIMPELPEPEKIQESTVPNLAAYHSQLIYSRLDQISHHSQYFDPSRLDLWQGENLPRVCDSQNGCPDLNVCSVECDVSP